MIDRVFEAISALLLAATVVITFLTVIYRYVIQSSLPWSYEVLLGLLVYLTFFSGFLALRQGAHLRIDVLVSHMPMRPQMVIYLFNQSVIIGVAVVMVIWGTEQAMNFSDRTSLMLDIPMTVFYAIIPLSGAAMTLECLRQIIVAVGAYRRGQPPYPAANKASQGAEP
ncbi:TRAP-type C4-dicarboxylate transport system permease small subunit [Natronocella acetinitrilica]|uniref:TRAP transporter small permease protein n=1 Tax=Natronocella acetinitrilica TaxID=414046 RepID=A0AAE3G378_9GAMM|nr:TRAP transporter small permease [Natronocella acetinitrilica]MCP1673588.1 TRAP-type C4-dicarboxylate transport system permease small subunit [Natronocella acetinitrilica]